MSINILLKMKKERKRNPPATRLCTKTQIFSFFFLFKLKDFTLAHVNFLHAPNVDIRYLNHVLRELFEINI